MRWRGFTPLTVLVGVFDLAGAIALAGLWYLASAERPADEQPWWAAVMVALALLGLAIWVISAGRRREALAASTLIVVGSAVVVLLG
jgi:hypothetical protein